MSAFLEVGTMATCVLNCKYCPQYLIKKQYQSSVKQLSLDNFKLVIDKMPIDSTISFAGFSEPCINPDWVEMVWYAKSKGHRILFSTTLVGMTIDTYNQIKHIQFDYFSVHLPDNNGKTTVPMTQQYKELLEYVCKNPINGIYKFHHHFGDLHNEIKHLIYQSEKAMIYDRAGKIEVQDEVKSSSLKGNIKCGHKFMFDYPDGGALLLPNGMCVLCCSDFGLQHVLGNLFTQSWQEIVESEEMKKVQAGLLDDSQDILCRQCYLAQQA
jgi:sulfatase maturation enzyme AslB (radical SAM superfamily)